VKTLQIVQQTDFRIDGKGGRSLRVSSRNSRIRSDCSYIWVRLRRQLPEDYCNCEWTALLYFRGHWYSTRNTTL